VSSSGRDPLKPQEQGNTKKKRRSLMDMGQEYPHIPLEIEPENEPEPELRPSSPEDRSYGDPSKIARFFPELALS
jgi:glutamine amidotransferase